MRNHIDGAPGRVGEGGPAGAARDQLIARIVELAPAMRRAFEVRPSAQERTVWSSLTGHQLEALASLTEGSLTMGEFCARMDISESAGTALSDRLIAHGMVTRQADPSDRRLVRLALSSKARDMVEHFKLLKSRRTAALLLVLDDDDLATLVRIQEQLVAGAGVPAQPARSRKVDTPAPGVARRRGAQSEESRT